jgi:FeS assembly protein IscX
VRSMMWTDIEDIAIALQEAHPEVNPLEIRFTDLLRWIGELPEFEDDIHSSNEKKLEAMQMAWYEEWQDANKA